MVHILVLDDDKNMSDDLKSYIDSYFKNKNKEYKIDVFNDSSSLKNVDFKDWDVFFLDIEMPAMNGIELAQEIRLIHKKATIVFVTGYDEYLFASYKVHAFDYIEKPICYNHIERVLNDAYMYGHIKEDNEIAIEFVSTHGNIKVLPSKIIYFEYVEKSTMHVNRCTRMVTTNGEHMLREKISAIYAKLDSSIFAVPHKSFIINFKNLKILKNNELMMIDNTNIPISQKKLREVKDKFNSYISMSLGG